MEVFADGAGDMCADVSCVSDDAGALCSVREEPTIPRVIPLCVSFGGPDFADEPFDTV